MKTFLKKYWSVILLIVILIVISVLSFVPSKYLLSNDNYSPELNPGLTLLRSIMSPAWRSYRVLGFASDSEQADIFRTGLMGLLGIASPSSSISQIFSLICLWTGVLSMAFLTRAIARDFVKTKYSNVVFLISGLIYLSTLWTAWVFNFNMMPYVTQYGFLPLLLFSIYDLFSNWGAKRLLFVFICSLLFTATAVIATLFLVDIVIIAAAVVLFGYLFKYKLKRIIYVFGIFFVTQLFWLLPFLFYTFSTSNDVISSYTNRSITSNTIDLEKQMMTLENSARFYTRLLGTVDDPSQSTYIFPKSNDYVNYDFFKVLAYIPLFFSLLGLVFAIAKKKYALLPLWFVLFVFLFLLKNQNPPLGGIYVWLQENISIFKQVFRWISSKLCQPYLIVLTITAGIGFLNFMDFLGSFFKKKLKHLPIIIFSILTAAALLGYSEYLFRGELFTQRATVTLPSQYKELAKYLQDDPESRIYYAPPANNGYFREYNWGFVGSQFLGYMIPNPLMDMSLAVGSDVGEQAMLDLNNDFESGDEADFTEELQKYDVRYVLVDRSLVKGRYGYDLNWEVLNTYTKEWNQVWESDFLELYQIDTLSNSSYVESLGTSIETFAKTNPTKPTIGAFDLNVGTQMLDSGYLVREFPYMGESQFLTFDPSSVDQEALPSTLSLEGGVLSSSPALPIIANVSLKSKKTFNISTDFSYLIAGNTVLGQNAVVDGITLESHWGVLDSLSTVQGSSLQTKNLTEIFKGSLPGDCAGDTYAVDADVIAEKLASGFSLKGNSELPCVSSNLKLANGSRYVGIIHLNWESQADTLVGVCLYSDIEKRCLNRQKFFNTMSGFGVQDILIPTLIAGEDDLAFSVYALNPSGGEASVIIRNVSFSYSNTFDTYGVSSSELSNSLLSSSIMKGDNLTVKIPLIYGTDSYIYLSEDDQSVWHPNTAKDKLKEYSVTSEKGMVQSVSEQYLNQYENILETKADEKYLWIWEGQNISNIPSAVCLTYQGDDKCLLDDTFYDGSNALVSRLFTTSSQYIMMDASYSSTSYASSTKNVLKNFVVMQVPDQWLDVRLDPVANGEYTQFEATNVSHPQSPSLYTFDSSSTSNTTPTLLTIPQSESKGWIAISNHGDILKDRVTVNGWKQGWDISNVDFDTIYIYYWPNFLGYLGYVLIGAEFTYLLIKVFRKRKYGRK